MDVYNGEPIGEPFMARLSARHCKRPYRSPAHVLSTTYTHPLLEGGLIAFNIFEPQSIDDS